MTRRSVRLTAVLALVSAALAVPISASPVLLWDENLESNVVGYKVYTGNRSKDYSSWVDVGSQTSNVLAGLNAGLTYFFAVTAYTADGLESAYSDEVSFTPRIDGVLSGLAPTSFNIENNQRVVGFSAQAGQQCRILASSDFRTWEEVYATTMLTNGTVRFIDGTADTAPVRFYRTVVTPVLPGLPDANGILGNVLPK